MRTSELRLDVAIDFLNDGKIGRNANAEHRRRRRSTAKFVNRQFCDRKPQVPVKEKKRVVTQVAHWVAQA